MHGDQQSQFSIDNKTGMVSVGKVLDREMISSYGKSQSFYGERNREGREGGGIILDISSTLSGHQLTSTHSFNCPLPPFLFSFDK